MAVKKIVLFPDPILSRLTEQIHSYDESLRGLVKDLTDTLYASPGVGLAAPQIGVSQAVSVIDTSLRKPRKGEKPPKSHGFIVLVNPIIVAMEGQQVPREGCLSVPDLLANVRRFEIVQVKAFDEHGRERFFQTEGFEALAFQHEIDHLNGHLFLDRVADIRTDVFRRK